MPETFAGTGTSLLAMIWRRDRGRCRYCGAAVRRRRRPPMIPEGRTMDHVIPRCQGGDTTVENCVVACAACNGAKGGRTPAEAGMVLLPVPDA